MPSTLGQAELAAGCGRYAVLNSAAEYSFFKRNRPVQVLKGSPLLSIIFQTLGTPFERQKKAPPMIRWCPESSGYTVETWVTRLTCKTIFRCCCSSRIQNGVSATASRQLRLTPRLMASLKAEVKGSHPHTQLTSGMPSCPAARWTAFTNSRIWRTSGRGAVCALG